jgi:hypothetical protein
MSWSDFSRCPDQTSPNVFIDFSPDVPIDFSHDFLIDFSLDVLIDFFSWFPDRFFSCSRNRDESPSNNCRPMHAFHTHMRWCAAESGILGPSIRRRLKGDALMDFPRRSGNRHLDKQQQQQKQRQRERGDKYSKHILGMTDTYWLMRQKHTVTRLPCRSALHCVVSRHRL